MNTKLNEFEKFAVSKGISTNTLNGYNKFNFKNYGGINPMILEEREMNVIGLDVFSRLLYDRVLYLGTAIDEDVANIVVAQLMYLNSVGDEEVKLFINSPGGSVIDGLAIYDIMKYVKPDVSTYCVGMCASMGAVLLSSGTKGRRNSLTHGEIMIHQLRGYNEGVFADMKINLQHSERLQQTLNEILANNTGKSIEEIAEAVDRDNWFTAKDALEFGLIDNVVESTK